jgi:hypothetical protein
MATAKPAAAGRALEDVLAAHIRSVLAVLGQVLADMGRGSPHGANHAMALAGASLADVETVRAFLAAHPAPGASP